MPFTYRHATEAVRASLADACERLGTPSDNVAYTCTDAVFQVFRRRLTVAQGLAFAGVLPAVLRAIFVAGWRLELPVPFAGRERMTREARDVRRNHNSCPETVIGDIAWALRRHVDAAEFERALARLPDAACAFWQVPGESGTG